jgi:hypothetical protein
MSWKKNKKADRIDKKHEDMHRKTMTEIIKIEKQKCTPWE